MAFSIFAENDETSNVTLGVQKNQGAQMTKQ